jgi:hypothetical protein
VSAGQHVPDAWLSDGFLAARSKFGVAGGDSKLAFTALECVAWTGSINERLRDDGLSSAELQGLWFVRNRVVHGGADVLRWVMVDGGAMLGAATLPFVLGQGPTYGWLWPSRAEFSARRSDVGAREYDSHLTGKNVGATLEAVAAHLRRVPLGRWHAYAALGSFVLVVKRSHAERAMIQP